jgi:diaminopimelate epimerase
MPDIKFHKMQGAGNDFIVIDNRKALFSLEEIIAFTPTLCNRKFGIGADGLLVLENPQLENVDYTMVYRNADGSDAGMCGNGSRCLALFAATHGFDTSQTFNVHNNTYSAEVNLKSSTVSVSFPNVELPSDINIDNEKLIQVYTGTEHVVQFTDQYSLERESDLIAKGSKIRYNNLLNPPGSNVNFVFEEANNLLNLQTYERGVEGLTLACGTGAIASAIASHFYNKEQGQDFKYIINVKGGILKVSFNYNKKKEIYHNVKLEGPANLVFEGNIDV